MVRAHAKVGVSGLFQFGLPAASKPENLYIVYKPSSVENAVQVPPLRLESGGQGSWCAGFKLKPIRRTLSVTLDKNGHLLVNAHADNTSELSPGRVCQRRRH